MEKERGRQAVGAGGRRPEEIYGAKLVLASASPRRAEILRAIGCSFETLAVNIDESRRPSEGAGAYVQRLAREKASAAAEKVGAGAVIGADTVVVVDEMILGKPRDGEDARRMLRLLSGRWHEVLTGVALVRAGVSEPPVVAYEKTRVRFASVSDEEIDWYVATNEPMDKAGAYAVQGRAALFIEKIEGDYWNVVGLPVRLLYKLARASCE